MRVGVTLPTREEVEKKKGYKWYFEWLENGGLQPIPLYAGERFKKEISGVLIPGGGDVDPSLYMEDNTHSEEIDRKRDEFELKVLEWAMREGVPLLAICRGIQIMNVFLGGSLIQDIEKETGSPVKHKETSKRDAHHCIILEDDPGLLSPFRVKAVPVNSSHHQAIKRLGKNLKILARAPDGIVEAVMLKDHLFFLGVQWHPERWRHETSDILLKIFKEAIKQNS